MGKKNDEQKIRQIESAVLDVQHLNQPILRRAQAKAVGHLFKLFGNLHRDIQSDAFLARSATTIGQDVKLICFALEQSLRWVIQSTPTPVESEHASFDTMDAESLALFDWAMEYSIVAIDHIAWSRGLLNASIDESKKAIRFSMQHNDHSLLTWQRQMDVLRGDRFRDSIPASGLSDYFKKWSSEFKLGQPPEIPDIDPESTSPLVEEMLEAVKGLVLPELDGEQQLDGFTLGEFRHFYAALYVCCWLFTELENYCDRTYGRGNDLGSMVLQSEEKIFFQYLSFLTGVAEETVQQIVELLTFQTTFQGKPTLRGSLSCQPFVRTKCDTFSLSTRLFTHSLPEDLISRSLIRKCPNIYEALIEKIERVNVAKIADKLRSYGFSVRMHHKIKRASTSVAPDLLVYDEIANVIVVADYKHSLTPIGPAEVANRSKDHKKNLEQMNKYARFFDKFADCKTSLFGGNAEKAEMITLLLYHSPMPLPVEAATEIVVGDWISFSAWVGFSKRAAGSDFDLRKAVESYANSASFSANHVEFKIHATETTVGEWTYIHENFVPANTD